MAKKPRGYYSVEAIQGRQQAALDEFNRQQGQQEQPTPVATNLPSTPEQASSILQGFSRPPATMDINNLPKPKPFMAYDTDQYGFGYYGTGVTGFLRKAWADLADPMKFMGDFNELASEEQAEINQNYEARVTGWQQIIDDKLKWSQWGEGLFGITSEELAAMPAGISTRREVAQATGENEVGALIETGGRLIRDTVQQTAWAGLGILGLGDQAMRKINATVMGIDAVADKFNEDTPKNWFQSLTQAGAISVVKDVFTVAGAIKDNKISWEDTKETIQDYQKGSEMVYTMMFDNVKNEEFRKGIAEGKDPGLLAQDLGTPLLELGGSIVGDPTTYMGMAILKLNRIGKLTKIPLTNRMVKLPFVVAGRIPTFTEIIGVSSRVGRGRLATSAQRFFESTIPELKPILSNIENVGNRTQALKILEDATSAVARKFDNFVPSIKNKTKWWNLAVKDSTSKIKSISADADYLIRGMMANEGIDKTLEIINDMVLIRRGGDDAIQAAQRLLPYEKYAFTDAGFMVGEIVNRMEGDDLLDIIINSKSHSGTYTNLINKLESVVSEFIPSVDEIIDARRIVSSGAPDIPDKIKDLAKMYDDLPSAVVAVRKLTKIPEVIQKTATKGMLQFFMNLRPASHPRNVFGSTIMMSFQTGLLPALENSIVALVKAPLSETNPLTRRALNFIEKVTNIKVKTAEDVLRETTDEIDKLVGFIPSEAIKENPFLSYENLKKTRYGVLPTLSRGEQIMSSKIILQTIKSEIQKALPAVLENLPEYQAILNKLPQNQQPLLALALRRVDGDFDDALDLFRNWTRNGEIEAWKLNEMPQTLRNFLDKQGLLKAFDVMQESATSSDDFVKFIDDVIEQYSNYTDDVARGMPSETQMPEGLYGLGEDLAKHAGKASDTYADLIQGWQNAMDEMAEFRRQAVTELTNITQTRQFAPDVLNQFNAILQETDKALGNPANAVREMNFMRDEVHRVIDSLTNVSSSDLVRIFQNPIKYRGKEIFNLSKIYPNLDFSTLDTKKARNLIWQAFFEQQASVYDIAHTSSYNKVMDGLNQAAKLIGEDITTILTKDKSGSNPFYVLQKSIQQLKEIEEQRAWQRFLRQFDFNGEPRNVLLKDVIGKFKETFKDWKGGENHVVRAVKKDLKQDIPYDQITVEQAYKAIWKRTGAPPFNGRLDEARIIVETKPAFLEEVKRWRDSVVNEWGVKVPTSSVDFTAELKNFKKAYSSRMTDVKNFATRLAVETRDFVLHDYERTYADHALSMFYGNSFHYWTTRTYMKGFETLLENPRVGSWYLSYKEFNSKQHADMPEWYRQNIMMTGLPGLDPNNQYFINLESMVNPIYGLTGVDFNDPRKRADWMSKTVDNMGSFGPGFSPLINWAVALNLYRQGKVEAAERWFGRLIPQTTQIKSLTATFGTPVELDPFVNLFGGGVDPYERNRVNAALAIMVQNGEITPEEMIIASRQQEGEIWERAIDISAEKRFTGDMTSFFFGTGLRPRTQDDMKIEKFWQDYSALLNAKSLMNPEQYREAWDSLREHPEYGMFVDALIVSRKSGEASNSAYTYNVLSRIPPGQTSDYAELIGMPQEWIQSFYDNKGDISKMGLTPQDQARFMAGVEDMGMLLAMPDGATRDEWQQVRAIYQQVNDAMTAQFGDGINAKISEFYEIDDSGKREAFLQENPEVEQALQYKDSLMVNTPLLMKYYGSIHTIERYYDNIIYSQLEKKYGSDVKELENEYNNLLTSEERANFRAEHGWYSEFLKEKTKLNQQYYDKILNVANYLPPTPALQDVTPQGLYQEQLAGQFEQQAQPFSYWQEQLGEPLANQILDYAYNNEPMTSFANRKMDYEAKKYGYANGEEFLRAILLTLQP